MPAVAVQDFSGSFQDSDCLHSLDKLVPSQMSGKAAADGLLLLVSEGDIDRDAKDPAGQDAC